VPSMSALCPAASRGGFHAQAFEKLADILDRLDAAIIVDDMSFPGADLHPYDSGTMA